MFHAIFITYDPKNDRQEGDKQRRNKERDCLDGYVRDLKLELFDSE